MRTDPQASSSLAERERRGVGGSAVFVDLKVAGGGRSEFEFPARTRLGIGALCETATPLGTNENQCVVGDDRVRIFRSRVHHHGWLFSMSIIL